VFVNCSLVDTQWQQYSTHLHTNSTQSDTKQTIHRTTQQFWKSAGRARSVRGFTLAFALQLRKSHGKAAVRVAEGCQLARMENHCVFCEVGIRLWIYMRVRVQIELDFAVFVTVLELCLMHLSISV